MGHRAEFPHRAEKALCFVISYRHKRASAFFNVRMGDSDRNRGMGYLGRNTLADKHQMSLCRPIAEPEALTQELPPLRCKAELPELPFSSLPWVSFLFFHSTQLIRPQNEL
jgi:hypothetical protein